MAKKALAKKEEEQTPTISLSLDENGGMQVLFETDKGDEKAVMATNDPGFTAGIINQICQAGIKKNSTDSTDVNFMLSAIKEIKPRDTVETMLIAQMAGVQKATMSMIRTLNHATTISQQDSASNGLTKLARTYTAQMEALRKYRTGGQQKVTVEHVTVNEGGQAIVGVVDQGGGNK